MSTDALHPGVTTTNPIATSLPVAGSERPDYKTPVYQRMEVRWTKCRLLMSGTQAMRDAGEDVLPRFEAEDDDAAYLERSSRAALYNGFARTVLASVGLLLQVEPALGTDMPPAMVTMWENVDAAGTHGRVFTRNLVMDGIVDGFAGVLVDMPRRPVTPSTVAADGSIVPTVVVDVPIVPGGAVPVGTQGVVLAPGSKQASAAAYIPGATLDSSDEAALGMRPYFIEYRADDVLRQTYAINNGRRILVLLVLRETLDEQMGLLAYRTIIRYRIYTHVRGKTYVQIWQAPTGGVGMPVLVEGSLVEIANVKEIPWSPLRCGVRIGDNEYKPPLEDLADLNIEHHQTKTNILNLEALAMVPTPVRIGAPRDADGNYPPMVFGPRSTIEAPHIEGLTGQPVYWLSPPVDVLAPAQATLDKTEAAMGAAGMAFLAPQTRAAETAQAREIDSRAQNATLSSVGQALQDCLESCIGYAAEMLGLTGGSITISTDYAAALMEPRAMLAYAELLKLGFPKHLALEALQAGGRIDADANLDDVAAEWDAELAAQQQNAMDQLAQQTALATARGTKPGQPNAPKNAPPPPIDGMIPPGGGA